MQPVFFADPKDADLRAEDRAFLFGPDLLVVPRWTDAPKLPKGVWHEVSLLDGKREEDGFQPTLKVRGGAIVPMEDVVQSTGESSSSPLTLLAWLADDGQAHGTLHEDSGDGFAYHDGEYALTHHEATTDGDVVTVWQDQVEGEMPLPEREMMVGVVTRNWTVTARDNVTRSIRVNMAR